MKKKTKKAKKPKKAYVNETDYSGGEGVYAANVLKKKERPRWR